MTLVSVIVPTHNRRQLLPQTIASICEQDSDDWELIIVDDGSSDATSQYLHSLHDRRIRTLRHETARGVSAARNTGLAVARGALCMFVDDDDLLRADAVRSLRAALDQHPEAVAASAACRIFREDGDSVRVFRPSRPHTRTIWREVLFGWWSNSGQNMYRTAIARDCGGFDIALRATEDRRLWFVFAQRGTVCILPNTTMEYRQHESQLSKYEGVNEVRQAMWAQCIADLPAPLRREGQRIRRAAELCAESERARMSGMFVMAARLQLAAALLAPRLVISPLVGRPMYWNLKKCLLRTTQP